MVQSSPSVEQDIQTSVQAQALVRMKLGIPVILLMMLSVWFWGPSWPWVNWVEITILATVYASYNIATFYIARRRRLLSAQQLINATAVLDPLMLSAWLMFMGPGSRLFICFYLFTTLGFGFRIGTQPMWLCQIVSVLGFSSVALVSPAWRESPLFAISNIVFLIVVPMYATVLIKKLRDAREYAERESKAKSQLLANVSHELRTPLAGIVASAQLIEAETSQTGIAARANTIVRLSRELTIEINDLLDSAKYEANAITLEATPFLLPELMEQVRMALASTAAAKDIGLSIHTDARIAQPVMGDTHYLSRVLMNLGSNAVKFTEKGRVDIALDLMRDDEEHYVLHFAVRDTGIGIPPELHQKIFDPFVQASVGTTRKYGGTGLGTSIAKQIVNLMGGELLLESEVGRGSLFHFELRLPKAERPQASAAAEQQARAVYGKRILIADDNPTNLMLTKELLERDRHSVVTARSGEEALESLNFLPFDAVFLDFNMSDMDGAQVLQLYRFSKLNPAPVFFLTADTTEATAIRLRDSGAAGVLHKPVTLDGLRAALVSLFDGEAIAVPPNAAREQALPGVNPAPRPAPPHEAELEYIDHRAIAALREISVDSEFLVEVLSTGIADMQRLGRELMAALDAGEISPVHTHAHALKGVCLSLGAARLASLTAKLMQISAPELRWTKGQWKKDVEEVLGPSIEGLREIMEAAAAGSA